MNMPINPVAAGTTANPMAAGASPAAASPLGGFEALLAALFPSGEGQVASALAKSGQTANAEPPADGAADDAPPGGLDAAAQTLLAAAFVTPVPLQAPATAPQGEAPPAAGAAVPAAQVPAAPIAPPPIRAEPAVPAQADAAQGAPPDTGFAAALGVAADTKAKTPAPTTVTAATPAAAAAPAPATAPVEGEPLLQEPLAGLAPQLRQTADAAPAPNASAPAPLVSPQAQQIAAASAAPAAPAPPHAPDAPKANLAVEGEGEGEGGGDKTKATAAPGVAAGKPAAVEAPGLRKPERADAPTQAPAPQGEAAPQPPHGPASAEAAPAATTATAHAPAHAAGVRGAPETVASLAATILKKLDERTTRFEMELDPAGLGKVDVRLEIGAHGRLTAAMAFENPQSAQELKNRSSELARALEQAGFDVSDGLSFDVADNSGGSNQNNGAQQEMQDAPWRGRAFLSALETAGAADAPPPAAINLARIRASGVDIKI